MGGNAASGAERQVEPRVVRRGMALQLPGSNGGDARWGDARTSFPRWAAPNWLLSFFLAVAIPVGLASVYFSYFAATQYETEERFAVVGSTQPLIGSSLLVLPGGNTGLSKLISADFSQDAAIVADFVRSSALVERADAKFNLRRMFGRPARDFVARLSKSARFEDIVSYWNDMVQAKIDAVSGVVIVTVRTFDPEDTRDLGDFIAQQSQKLIEEIMARDRTANLALAKQEVDRAIQQELVILGEEREFRNANALIDPEGQAKSLLNTIVALRSDRLGLQTELEADRLNTSNASPTVDLLQDQVRALDAQIEGLEKKITLQSDKARTALSGVFAAWQAIELRRQFADVQFQSADAELAAARHDAESRHIYIEMYQPPNVPDEAVKNRALFGIVTVLAICAAIWAATYLVLGVVRLHID